MLESARDPAEIVIGIRRLLDVQDLTSADACTASRHSRRFPRANCCDDRLARSTVDGFPMTHGAGTWGGTWT
jgi:hypothetical protein